MFKKPTISRPIGTAFNDEYIPGYTGYNPGIRMGTAGMQGTRGNCHRAAIKLRTKAGSALDGMMPRVPNRMITGSPNDLYKSNNPKILTNSKNRSSIIMGDNRDNQFNTMNLQSYKSYAEVNMVPSLHNLANLAPEGRKKVYENATKRVTADGVRRVERSMMNKLQQRSAGGQAGLRNAFKYFDRDNSGTIDLDEFFSVVEFIGFSFNEDQVVALFGHYDVNLEGELDYYAFINRVMNGSPPPMPPRTEFKMFETIPGKVRRYGAGPPLAFKVGQHVDKLVKWDVKRAFDKFDFDKSGSIERRELPLLMVALGMHLTPQMVDNVLIEMDVNQNGAIEFQEFFSWFVKEAAKGTDAILNGEKNFDNKCIGALKPRTDANQAPLLLHDLKLSY